MRDTKEKMKEELEIKNIEIINSLYNKFKEKTVEHIKGNPFELGHFLNLDVNVVKKIIENLSTNEDKIQLISFYIIFTLEMNKSNNGHVFVYENNLFSECNERIKGISNSEFKRALSLLENKQAIFIDETCIYLQELYQAEVSLSEIIYDKNNKKTLITEEEAEMFVHSYNEVQLNEKQKQAVAMALRREISIISGSAGTGKTTVLKAIVDGFKKFMDNPVIKLVSLSGKAVRRIEQATGIKAYTIHSLLHDKKKINADVLILDECTMIGIELFAKLLSSLKENCIVVITGDIKQLPAIEAGKVFNDLIQSELIKNTELTQIVRQANDSIIIENANKIAQGKGFEKGGIKLIKGQFEFCKCESKNINREINILIEALLNKNISIYDIQVIAPQKNNNGTIELNKVIAETFNRRANKTAKFEILDPVIQTTNNYKKRVFNGEKGKITYLTSMMNGDIKELTVKFDDRDVVYKNDEIDELGIAYCLNVHKMQGSESKVVILVISPKHRNLNRNLIYTAITRAVEHVIIIGDKEAFNNGIAKENRTRNSNLINRLHAVHCTTV